MSEKLVLRNTLASSLTARDFWLLAGFLRIGLHQGGGYFTISSRTA